jgi:peptide/nickel transport system permease protein
MSEIIGFALRRLTSAAITLFLVSLMIFSAIHALPGGYADVFLGAYATPEARARIERQFGLNEPLPVQYVKWLGSAVRGDFGVSLVTQKPVAEEFAARLPVTAGIATLATLLAVLIGLPAGLLGGLASDSRAGRTMSRLLGSLAISVPDFVIGTVLLFVISRYLPWATIFSTTLLPAITLSALGIGFVMTATRHATIAASEGQWVLAAIARGMPRRDVLRHHVLRNAAIPVVTVLGIYFGYMLGGTAIVEATFTVPGIGRYILQAVQLRDYPVVQAGALIAATLFITLNLLVDLLYALLDPRIRTAR